MRPGNRRLAAGAALAAAAVLAPAAQADKQIQAQPTIRYSTTDVTMDQGERLTFQNLDVADHDVTATRRGGSGAPLFHTPLIGTGEEAFVEGSQYLTTGDYSFVCSIHANMRGTLHVTSAGTPAQNTGSGPGAPAAPADKTPPKLRVKIRSTRSSRVSRVERLVAEVSVNEGAKVALTANARVRGKTTTIATGTAELPAAGVRRPELKLTRAGRGALRKARRVAITLIATAVDGAGNRSRSSARATLRR